MRREDELDNEFDDPRRLFTKDPEGGAEEDNIGDVCTGCVDIWTFVCGEIGGACCISEGFINDMARDDDRS